MPLSNPRRRSRRITLNCATLHLTPAQATAIEQHLTSTGEGIQTYLNRLVAEDADQLASPPRHQD
jgi:hypothetical protein